MALKNVLLRMRTRRIRRTLRKLTFRRLVVLSASSVYFGIATEAAAQGLPETSATPAPLRAALAGREPAPPPGVFTWQPYWRRSDAWDFALTGVSLSGAVALLWTIEPRGGAWDSPILFDVGVRRSLAATTRSGRSRAGTVSDVLVVVAPGYLLLDSALFAALPRGAPELGWENLLLDAEAYAVTLLLNTLVKVSVQRERPYVKPCVEDPNYDRHCATPEAHVSFFSQHSALTATVAGLTCATHSRLPIYGSGYDMGACFGAVAVTSTAGVLRVVSDNHWASDVITGHLVGFGVGFFLPRILHFHDGAGAVTRGARVTAVAPLWSAEREGMRGVTLSGAF